MTYNKEQETVGHFLRRGEFRLAFSQLRKAQFSTQRKVFPALLLDLRLFPHPEMHSGCLWLLTRETPLMRAICNYFWLPLGSRWRFVIFPWHFSQTPFNFICKTVLWSSVSPDQAFNFKKLSSIGERLSVFSEWPLLGQVPHQKCNSIIYLFRVHTLSAGGNGGSCVLFETFFGKPRKSDHPPFHHRL